MSLHETGSILYVTSDIRTKNSKKKSHRNLVSLYPLPAAVMYLAKIKTHKKIQEAAKCNQAKYLYFFILNFTFKTTMPLKLKLTELQKQFSPSPLTEEWKQMGGFLVQ